MSHGHMILATVAIEFDPDAEYLFTAGGAPRVSVIGHTRHGEMSNLGDVASSEPGGTVSAAVLAALSVAVTTDEILDGAHCRLGVHSFKYLPASPTPSTPMNGDPR